MKYKPKPRILKSPDHEVDAQVAFALARAAITDFIASNHRCRQRLAGRKPARLDRLLDAPIQVSSKRGSDRLHLHRNLFRHRNICTFHHPSGAWSCHGSWHPRQPEHASVFTSGCGPPEICEVPLGYEVNKRQFSNPLAQFLVSAIPANLGAESRDVQFDSQVNRSDMASHHRARVLLRVLVDMRG